MNMQSFFLEIAEISLGMSLLIPLMLLVLRLIGRKFTAKCRYILWTLVLLRLTIPFSFGFLPALIEVPVEPINEVQIKIQPDITIPVSEYTPPQIPQGIAVQPQTPVQNPVVSSVPEFPEPEEQPDEATAEQPTEVTWELILNIPTAVYCAGAALFFGWNIVSYIVYVHKILHAGREPYEHMKTVYTAVCSSIRLCRIPRLLLSQDVSSPAAFGIIRRHIVLPDIEFTDNALTGTLRHEVTHCRRGDLYIKVCTLFARSLHWFNPLVHLAAYRCEMEMELSCDEAVLAGCSDETRAAYGEMMLDIICRCRQKRGTLTTHFNPKKNAVKARLTNILYGSGKLHGRWLIAVCLILCLAAGTIVVCRVEAENTEQTEEGEDYSEETIEAETLPEIQIDAAQLRSVMQEIETEKSYPAEEYLIHVTGLSVPVRLTMSLGYITEAEAHGQTIQIQTPLDIYGNCNFDLFEADGAVILEGGVYRIGDIYVLSPEGTGESHPGSEASYYLWLDENGQLKYHLTNNYAAPIIQTGALSAAVGYDEFWYASGDVEIVSGKIVYAPPTVSETISDRYDPDEEFQTLYQGIYGNFNHIDEVFEMNRWSRILERDRPAAADIYRTFLDTVVAPYTEYIGAMEYIDLDGNNIDELILYSRNAGVSSAAEIYTIEDGEVCSFSNSGISVITTGSDAPKALAKPSKNANDFRFFGLPSSSENRQMLSFQPCFYGGVPYTILCSYNEHETMKSTVYYSFTRDINNLLDVAPLGTYAMEAVSSDPSLGWNCYVNGQPVTGQQYMDSMKKLWTSIYIRYSVKYTEENTISGFDLLGETTGSASEPLREVLHTFSTHLPMVYLSMNGSSPLHGWDSAPVTQLLNTLSSSYTFEPLTAMEVQGTTQITLTSSDGTWSLIFRENSNDFSLTIGSETYRYRASASFTGQPEPIGTLLGITCLSRSIEETLLTGKDHISAFLADGYTVTEENGMLRMQSPDPELTDTILFRPEWEIHDFRWLGYEPIGSMNYRSSWQMSITNTANGAYGLLFFAAELAEEAGTLKLKGIDLS